MTGVQTCALPIYEHNAALSRPVLYRYTVQNSLDSRYACARNRPASYHVFFGTSAVSPNAHDRRNVRSPLERVRTHNRRGAPTIVCSKRPAPHELFERIWFHRSFSLSFHHSSPADPRTPTSQDANPHAHHSASVQPPMVLGNPLALRIAERRWDRMMR